MVISFYLRFPTAIGIIFVKTEGVELTLRYEKHNVSILMSNKVSVILIGVARKCPVNPDTLMGMRASKNLVFFYSTNVFKNKH